MIGTGERLDHVQSEPTDRVRLETCDRGSTPAARYALLLGIRLFEQSLLDLFATGLLAGTTHTCIGQETIAVGVMSAVAQDRDIVFSNHRGHGHFLAYCGEIERLYLEVMGKPGGVCGGRGGSQHLQFRNFYSNGIQGGIVPVSAGMALAEKLERTGALAVAFMGDGTLGEGAVYEAFNIAALWQLPIVFIVENNGYSQSTPSSQQIAGTIRARPEAFGIPTAECSATDVDAVLTHARAAVDAVRSDGGPRCVVCSTYRLAPHSKGDDHRPAAELELAWSRDPLKVARALVRDDSLAARIERETEERVELARRRAIAQPGFDAWQPISKDGVSLRTAPDRQLRSAINDGPVVTQRGQPARTVLESLNQSLHDMMTADERVVMLGEDILDPYGGAFKVTRGLSSRFPGRVLATPLSEAAIVGLASGLAMRGLRPVAGIMFGDFLWLAGDQLVNHAAKFRWMYNDGVRVPIVIRTPSGGRRGYGPTHSQSVEKHFCGVPGLLVVAPHVLLVPGDLLKLATLECDDPVVFIESKTCYGRPLVGDVPAMQREVIVDSEAPFPTVHLRHAHSGRCDGLLWCYGGMVPHCVDALQQLREREGLFLDLVAVSQLSPVPTTHIRQILAASRPSLSVYVEEGSVMFGWSAELAALVQEQAAILTDLQIRHERIGAAHTPIPSSRELERQALPQADDIVARVLECF